MHAGGKTPTAGYLYSRACFRQEIIPLNTTLAGIPFKLEASIVKSDRDDCDISPSLSEKVHLSEAKQKSEG